jgi:hypothetical protein
MGASLPHRQGILGHAGLVWTAQNGKKPLKFTPLIFDFGPNRRLWPF